MFEDRILLMRFKAGSVEALERIYRKYKDTLLRLAYALSHNADLAEDAVQDVFVTFAASGHRIRLEGSLKCYLATCVVNRVRNAVKRGHLTDRVQTNASDQSRARETPPDRWIVLNETAEQLSRSIGQLAREQREVVLMRLIGDMPFKRIAAYQGVSINTVQSRYRYGLQTLRSLLNGEVNQ